MTDREKIIKGLKICSAGKGDAPNDRDCTSCPYYPAGYTGCTCKPLMTDALALLKAQEPMRPRIIETALSKKYHSNMFKNYYCGNCGEFLHTVDRKDLFCSQCGRLVKWE